MCNASCSLPIAVENKLSVCTVCCLIDLTELIWRGDDRPESCSLCLLTDLATRYATAELMGMLVLIINYVVRAKELRMLNILL